MNTSARLLIRSCVRNDFSTAKIIKFIGTALPGECPCRRTIFYWIKKFRKGETTIEDRKRQGRRRIPEIEKKIRHVLRKNRFSSTRKIGRLAKVSHQTIFHRLKKMKMKRLKLKVVPHPLNEGFMRRRATVSQNLYDSLINLQPNDVITSDESWFFFNYPANSMWVRDRSELIEVENRFQSSKKVMISIFWNFGNLVMIRILPEDSTYNTDYVLNSLIPDLDVVALSVRPSRGLKSYWLHWDNARPHCSKRTSDCVKSKFKGSLVHPPYSPDLAQSDFFLFGFLKKELEGKVIEDENQLLFFWSQLSRQSRDKRNWLSSMSGRNDYFLQRRGEIYN